MPKLTMVECPLCDQKRLKCKPSNEKVVVVNCPSCQQNFYPAWIPYKKNIVLLVGVQHNPDFKNALAALAGDDTWEDMKKVEELMKQGITPFLNETHLLGYEELDEPVETESE